MKDLCELQMGLLVPDDDLLHFTLLVLGLINQNKTSFIQGICHHLTLCLRPIEPNLKKSLLVK